MLEKYIHKVVCSCRSFILITIQQELANYGPLASYLFVNSLMGTQLNPVIYILSVVAFKLERES